MLFITYVVLQSTYSRCPPCSLPRLFLMRTVVARAHYVQQTLTTIHGKCAVLSHKRLLRTLYKLASVQHAQRCPPVPPRYSIYSYFAQILPGFFNQFILKMTNTLNDDKLIFSNLIMHPLFLSSIDIGIAIGDARPIFTWYLIDPKRCSIAHH